MPTGSQYEVEEMYVVVVLAFEVPVCIGAWRRGHCKRFLVGVLQLLPQRQVIAMDVASKVKGT
jgi:hypothetical protein